MQQEGAVWKARFIPCALCSRIVAFRYMNPPMAADHMQLTRGRNIKL